MEQIWNRTVEITSKFMEFAGKTSTTTMAMKENKTLKLRLLGCLDLDICCQFDCDESYHNQAAILESLFDCNGSSHNKGRILNCDRSTPSQFQIVRHNYFFLSRKEFVRCNLAYSI